MRINFDRYKQEEPEQPPEPENSLLSKDMRTYICNSPKISGLMDLVDKNTIVHWKTSGDWSMHQLMLACIEKTGAADVYISSYAVSETAARIFSKLKDEGIIKSLHCVFDNRVETRTAGSAQLMKAISNRIALIPTHAKVTVLTNEHWQLAIIGSANYTENKRWEAGMICCNVDVVEFHLSWIKQELENGTK